MSITSTFAHCHPICARKCEKGLVPYIRKGEFLTTKLNTSMLINFQCLENLENSKLNLLIRPQYTWNGKHQQTRRKMASFVAIKYITSKSMRGKNPLDRHFYSTCLVNIFLFLPSSFSLPPVLPDANIFQNNIYLNE